MKCTIPEISWHNREPVLSVDICPVSENFYKLATGGGDSHVVIWQLSISDSGAVKHDLLSDLTRHQKAVNCVRWSNDGSYLASGDDDANIIIWQLKTDNVPSLDDNNGDKEIWNVFKVLRGHKEDVYDLCWSVDNTKLFSGSVDNTAILWDIAKGKLEHILADHKGFVQGVTWDPKNQLIATISTDRTCRIFDPTGKHVKARIQKGKLNVPQDHNFCDVEVKFFHDDTFKSFFRRLHFTPDGSLLVVPSGKLESDNCQPLNATLVFKLDNWHTPAVVLPIPRQSSTVVRCCPVLFELHEDGPEPYVNLPYRMIFAVGTDHDIILYDTQQAAPFARFQEIHYTRVTDLTWSHDGLLLVASSTDGFCSLVTFEPDELGVPYVQPEADVNESILDISGCEEIEKDDKINESEQEIVTEKVEVRENEEEKKKRPSFLLQWAQNPSKKLKIDPEQKQEPNGVIEILDSPEKKAGRADDEEEKEHEDIDNKLTSRRTVLLDESIKSVDNESKIEEKKLRVKKRPSFLKQWTENTSKRKSLNNEETIPLKTHEIIKKEKSPEKINILTPRRITPAKIANVSKPTVTKIEKPTEKINVLIPKRIKPILVQEKPGSNSEEINLEKQTINESDEDELDEKEMKEYQSASKDIKDFFSRDSSTTGDVSEKHSDAKPIAVRRKVKEQQNSDISQNNLQKDKIPHNNNCSDAKLIAFRRKPKEVVDLTAEKDNEIGQNSNEKGAGDEEEVLKVTPVRRKLELVTDNEIKRKKSDKTSKEMDLIRLDLDDKKDNPELIVKVKISAMVPKKKERKEQKATPKKNTLLSFLQKSTEKQKKTKKKKVDEKLDTSIDLTLDDSEAQDAWSPEKRSKSSHEECVKRDEVEEDVTEDFCLRLEESQDSVDHKTKKDRNEDEVSHTMDEIIHKEKRNSGENKIADKALNQNIDKERKDSEDKVNHVADEKNDKDRRFTDNQASCKKTPRKVALITVASPKNKVISKRA